MPGFRCAAILLTALLAVLWRPAAALAQNGDPADAATETEAANDAAPATVGDALDAAGAETEADAADVAAAEDETVTQGEAFIRKLKQGGRTMIFLLLLSIFGVSFAIERFVRLRRGVIAPAGLADEADRLWRAGRHDAVANLRDKSSSTLAEILSALARHRDSSTVDVSMIAGDIASRDLRRHLARAYPLAVVATLAPLLGLLGTIIGMIGAFDKVAAAGRMGDASMLGGDISKALITTGVGLGIAVPALALYHYFKARTNLLGIILEEEVSELITQWFVEEDETAAPPQQKAAEKPTPAPSEASAKAAAEGTSQPDETSKPQQKGAGDAS